MRKAVPLGFSRRRSALAVMIALAIVAMACGTSGAPSAGDSNSTPSSGTAGHASAPTFEVETYNHGTFDLTAYEGQPVVLNFWFPSCAPCVAEMPDIQEAYEHYGDQVAFLGAQQVSLNTPQEGREFLEDLGITYPNFADEGGKVQFAYAVLNYPTTVFLDKDHNINRAWMGLITKKNLEEQIQAIAES